MFTANLSDDTAVVPRVVQPPPPDLTWVDLVWFEKRIEHWIRFGDIAAEDIIDRRRRRVAFRPGAVFALVRWAANDVGTIVSRIDVLRAVPAQDGCSTLPGVTPGGDLLLRLSGWGRVQQTLQVIDAIEALGVEPTEAAPDYWRHVHTSLTARSEPRPYTRARHRAWRLRRELEG